MNREAGRDYLVSFVFVPKFVYGPPGGSRQWAWRSRGGAGNPSAKNIERYVHKHNESLEIDGVNSHLGRRDAIYGGSIVDQKTGETVAEWENKGIVNFYKSKPMFEVVGRELLKVARELVASYPSNYFKSSSARSRANQSGLMDVENEDLTAPGLVAKLEEWQKEEGGVDGYVYDETAKALMKLGLRMPPGIKRAASVKAAEDDFSMHFYDSSWTSAVSNRQDWLGKNANDKQKLALVRIVIPGLLKTRQTISSGRMSGSDMLLNLSVRDESVKIAENGQVFLYGNRVSNPTQFAKQHEEGL